MAFLTQLYTNSLANQNLSAALLLGTYTEPGTRLRKIYIGVFATQIAGNGSYVVYATRQIAGAGAEYEVGARTTVAVPSGVTSQMFPTIALMCGSADVIKVYLVGLAGDTTTPDTIVNVNEEFILTDASGNASANLVAILGTSLTETAGQIAAAFIKFFNKATPTGTVNSIPDAVAGAAGGIAIVGSNVGAAASVTGAVGSVTGNVGGNLIGNVNGNVSGNVSGSVGSVAGAVGSVTGAVGSVTGNVGGNVVGSVASVAGAVGSVVGNVGGDVSGKVLGGGSGTIAGDGVRAASVTGAVGSVTGAVGSVTGNVGGNVVGSVGSVLATVSANLIQWLGVAPAILSTSGYVRAILMRWLTDDVVGTPNALESGDVPVGAVTVGDVTLAAAQPNYAPATVQQAQDIQDAVDLLVPGAPIEQSIEIGQTNVSVG